MAVYCNRCGKAMELKETITTIPPIEVYECSNCGWTLKLKKGGAK